MQKTDPRDLLTRMGNTQRATVGRAVMTILDRLQEFPADVQVSATAVIFLRMCQAARLRPSEVLGIAANIHTDGNDKAHPELRCVDSYIRSQF